MVKYVREILSCLDYNAEFVKLQLFFQFHRCYYDNTLNFWDWYTASYMIEFFRDSVQEGITNKYTHKHWIPWSFPGGKWIS